MEVCSPPGRCHHWLIAAALVTGVAVAVPAAMPSRPLSAEAGSVEGRVQVVSASTRRLASAGAYPSRVVGIAGDSRTSELANVVVFVDAKPFTPAPSRASIRQEGEEFLPHLVAITIGSTVEFPNEDVVFHNVFSLSRAGTFDLGRYPKGRSKTRVFDKSGLIKVFCHLHSQMSAMIRVFDHPYFSIPGPDGRFSIPDVPPGEYNVVAWHERVGEVTHHTVVVGGRASTLAFSLPFTDNP